MSSLVDIVLPSDQQEGTESILSIWFKQPGEFVNQNDPLAEIATDKVNVEIAAPASGVLTEVLIEPKTKVEPGQILGRIDTSRSTAVKPQLQSHAATSLSSAGTSGAISSGADLSPAVRKLLKEHDLSADQITGSGKGGRITHQDVEAFIAKRGNSADSRSATEGSARAPSLLGPSRRVPHSVMRKSIAEHMLRSVTVAPHVTTVFETDLSAILANKALQTKDFEQQGVKLTLSAYFVHAAAHALQAVPEVNSTYHEDALEIFAECNIGIATAVEQSDGAGLVVPVLRRAETLSLLETARRLQELTTKARAGTLTPAEVRGGTFTISNHGMTGSLIATPIIINQPQSAILGIGKLEKRARVVEQDSIDTIVIKPLAYVSLTIDHRVLDGLRANKFMTEFVRRIEQW